MLRVGFEPTISAGERPKTYALDRASTEIGEAESMTNLVWNSNLIRQRSVSGDKHLSSAINESPQMKGQTVQQQPKRDGKLIS